MPVVAAGELHHQVAAGRPARQADGRHGRLGAGGHEAHPFGRGHTSPHRLGQLGLGGGRCPEGQTAGGRLPYGLDDAGMGVPEERRAPRTHQIDIVAPLGVEDMRAASARDEGGRAAHRAEGAHGGVHSSGDDGAGGVEEGGVGDWSRVRGRHRSCCHGSDGAPAGSGPGRADVPSVADGCYSDSTGSPTVRRLIGCRGEARGYGMPPGCWGGVPSRAAQIRAPCGRLRRSLTLPDPRGIPGRSRGQPPATESGSPGVNRPAGPASRAPPSRAAGARLPA